MRFDMTNFQKCVWLIGLNYKYVHMFGGKNININLKASELFHRFLVDCNPAERIKISNVESLYGRPSV